VIFFGVRCYQLSFLTFLLCLWKGGQKGDIGCHEMIMSVLPQSSHTDLGTWDIDTPETSNPRSSLQNIEALFPSGISSEA